MGDCETCERCDENENCSCRLLAEVQAHVCSRQIYCLVASCVFVKFLVFRADLLRSAESLRFEQICCARQNPCVSGRFVPPVGILAFRADLLRRQNPCVLSRFIAPGRILAFRADLLRSAESLRFGQICCARQICFGCYYNTLWI